MSDNEGTMKIFIAGATGAIGRPLVAELIRQGHTVTGMARSEADVQTLSDLGASVAHVSAFDAPALEDALRQSKAEIVIDQLTSLPKDPSDFAGAFPGDRKLRLEGGGNLFRAAQATGIQRYVQEASGFFLKPGSGLADESESLAIDATPGIAASAKMYAELEKRARSSHQIEALILRYGFFYGPNTWYCPEGAVADQVRLQQYPIAGQGNGIWSFVHIDDAAWTTVAALTAPPGVYHIVDSDPSPMARWLPKFAQWVGAPPPRQLTEEQVLSAAGEDAVYYATKLRGASNQKARRILEFQPRRLQWLDD